MEPHLLSRASSHESAAVLQNMGFAHGLVMVIAFGFMFPMGATFLRLFGYRHVVRMHGLIQLAALSCATAGVTLGLYIAKHSGYGIWHAHNGHKILGFTTFVIMLIMPFLGAIHHWRFKAKQQGTWQGYTHRLLGRAALVMGAVNIGLGLQLGRAKNSIVIGYSTITALAFAAYFAVTIWKGPEGRKIWHKRAGGNEKKLPERLGKLGDQGASEM